MPDTTQPDIEALERSLGLKLPKRFKLEIELYDLDSGSMPESPPAKISLQLDDGKLTKRLDRLQSMGLVYW